LLSQWRIPKSP